MAPVLILIIREKWRTNQRVVTGKIELHHSGLDNYFMDGNFGSLKVTYQSGFRPVFDGVLQQKHL